MITPEIIEEHRKRPLGQHSEALEVVLQLLLGFRGEGRGALRRCGGADGREGIVRHLPHVGLWRRQARQALGAGAGGEGDQRQRLLHRAPAGAALRAMMRDPRAHLVVAGGRGGAGRAACRGADAADGGMNHWAFVTAAYALTLAATGGLVFASWRAMRGAERDGQ